MAHMHPQFNWELSRKLGVADKGCTEEVYENYTSGGGFSNIFPIPSYQKSAVAHYFANNKLPFDSYNKLSPNEPNPKVVNIDGLIGTDPLARYNGIGRGYPDVSANGLNYTTYINGIFSLTGGTSEAAPIFASIINRINEERLAAGKTSVGFLNPTLYANPSALNDVTKGSNRGCRLIVFPSPIFHCGGCCCSFYDDWFSPR